MELLPDANVRSALLDALARVIEARGFETFVRAPILEPSTRCFPDPWEPSARGVRALALRLLTYAELDDVDASVEIYDDDHEVMEAFHGTAAAFFAGIDEDGVCHFGAHENQLDESDAIVGSMSHEIAHAYRAFHDIDGPHGQIEEEDTDVTTVYLGFGVLATNRTYLFRKEGGLEGGMVRTSWKSSQAGYLPPESMAFLLAAQAVARGLASRDVKKIAAQLEPQQRDFFGAAVRELSKDVDALRITLGVPPPEAWPSERQLEVPSLREDANFAPASERSLAKNANDAKKQARVNDGANVFRVRSTSARRWALWGLFAGAIAGGFVMGRLGGGSPWLFAMVIAGVAVGWIAGARRRSDECSDPQCAKLIPIDEATTTCPGCGGTIRGVIRDAADRLEAEEALVEGRTVNEGIGAVTERRRRVRRRRFVAAGLVAALVAFMMFSERIPRPSDVRQARKYSREPVTLRLTGEVVRRLDDRGRLRSMEDGKELGAFLLSDPTDTMEVWYAVDDLPRNVEKGDHVRLWGHFVDMRIEDGARAEDSRSFVATSLSVD